jgi:uncharacterized protein YecE (DUF72 family)
MPRPYHRPPIVAGVPISPLFVGTAGWSIPRASAERCAGDGTHLERYARVFSGAEINSSFHRPHAATTYTRWARSTGRSFRFAVKVPREITHDLKLRGAGPALARFLDETAALGVRRGPLLIQLPPSLAFDARIAARFFRMLRDAYGAVAVCEPRHPSWFAADADALLVRHAIGRVAADPPPVPAADRPGGWPGVVYYRLHGSPRKYWSPYDAACLDRLAGEIREARRHAPTWCIFDNTASGAALENAWELLTRLR